MAASPKYKVYDSFGDYQAACKEAEAAAAVVSIYSAGSTIRYGHSAKDILWTEGENGDGSAGDSYDHVAETCTIRRLDIIRKHQLARV